MQTLTIDSQTIEVGQIHTVYQLQNPPRVWVGWGSPPQHVEIEQPSDSLAEHETERIRKECGV
jgi:hypothetical protein